MEINKDERDDLINKIDRNFCYNIDYEENSVLSNDNIFLLKVCCLNSTCKK